MVRWDSDGAAVWERHPFRIFEAQVRGMSPYRGSKAALVVREVASELKDDTSFMESAEIATRIEHPSLAPVLEWDPDRGRWLQERFEGWSIEHWLRGKGRFPLALACAVVERVCAALEYLHAHALGTVLHRDICTSTVFVTVDGRIKVENPIFVQLRKIAYNTGPTPILPSAISHLSPEEVSASPLDETTDLYQATVLLFSMLTGTPPFDASSMLEMVRRIREVRAPLPSERVLGLPDSVNELVASALHKDPGQRPTSVKHLRELIAAIRQDEG